MPILSDDTIIAYSELNGQPAGLTPRQEADAQSLTIEKRRAERRAVYALINKCIAPGLQLAHNPDGAPYLLHPDGTPFGGYFSLSHCQTAVAIAYSASRRIGIDIEDASPRLRHIADKYLSPDEKQLLAPLTYPRLLAAWTFKEAAFKSLGNPRLVLSGILIDRITSLKDSDTLAGNNDIPTASPINLADAPIIAIHATASSPTADDTSRPQAIGYVTFNPTQTRAISVVQPTEILS